MKFQNGLIIAAGCVAALGLALAPTAGSQEQFPDEPGRDTLFLACTQCHSLGKMIAADMTKDDWEFLVYDMIARGSPVEEDEIDDLKTYLQNNFASDRD